MKISQILQTAFLLLIFSLGFMLPSIQFRQFSLPLTDFIFPAVLLLWLLTLDFRKSWFYLPLGVYLAALILATVFSSEPTRSLTKLPAALYLIGLAVLTFNVVRTIETAKKVVLVWLAATLAASLVSFLALIFFFLDRENWFAAQTLSHFGSLPPGNYPRVRGSFQNFNMLANYLNVSLVFALAAFYLKWIDRRIFYTLLFFLSVALTLTISPGIGGAFLGVGFWLWLMKRERRQFMQARVFLIIGVIGALLFFGSTLVSPNVNELTPFYWQIPYFDWRIYPSIRLLAWLESLRVLLENPLFGRGTGVDIISLDFATATGEINTLTDAHQMWLNIAGQSGLVGLGAICFLCFFMVKRAAPFALENSETNVLRVACGLAFVCAFLYQGLAGSFEDARHLWVLIGLLGGLSETER